MEILYSTINSLVSAENFIAEIFGFVAFIFLMIQNQGKDRRQILRFSSLGAFAFVIHFSLLAAWTGAIVHVVAMLRNYIFSNKEKSEWRSSRRLLYGFLLLPLIVMVVTWDGYISLLPAIGASVFTYAIWQSKPLYFRTFTLVSVLIFWLPYTVLVGSYSGTLTQLAMAAAVLYGMYKHDSIKEELKTLYNRF